MKKKKFDYEVKDFEPTIRKKPMGLAGKIVIAVVLLAVVGFFVFSFLKEALDKTPVYTRANDDVISHLIGKESYIVKALGAEDMYDVISDGIYETDARLGVKSLKDFGLGIESYANGIGVKFSNITDAKNHVSKGSLQGTWTIVSIDLLEYMFRDSEFIVSSETFLDESLLVFSANKGMQAPGFNLDLSSEITEKKLDRKKVFEAGGKEYNCTGYDLTIDYEMLDDPVTGVFYVNNKKQMLYAKYNYATEYTADDGKNYTLDAKMEVYFTGKKHPTDCMELNVDIKLNGRQYYGHAVIETTDSDGEILTEIEGSFDLPSFTLSGELEMTIEKDDGSFTLDFVGDDGYSEAKVEVEGTITAEHASIVAYLDRLYFGYEGEDIIELDGKLVINESDKDKVKIKEPKGEIKDITNLTPEDIEALIKEIEENAGEFREMFESFT